MKTKDEFPGHANDNIHGGIKSAQIFHRIQASEKLPIPTDQPVAYITQTTTDEVKEYFIELISDQPKERLRQRIKNYLYFYQGMEWQEETGRDSPTILIICPSDELLEYIKSYTKRKLYQFDEACPIIHLTTKEQINQAGITGDIWKEI